MKKLFALTLAVAMVMSLASVAFAADYNISVSTTLLDPDLNSSGFNPTKAWFDDCYYFAITDNDKGGAALTDYEVAKKIKVKATWDAGESYVEGVKVVKAMNNGVGQYFIEVTINEQPTKTGSYDILGTLTISGSSLKFDGLTTKKEVKIPVAMTVANSYYADEKIDDDYAIFKFSESGTGANELAWDEEHELELYGGMGRFIVNTVGQGKIIVSNDVKYNEGIENIASDVNYVYFNGNDATFNKIGDLYLTANENEYLYKVNADGSLAALDAKYDEVEEAFVVRTRVIGKYVIAETELDVEDINTKLESKDEVTTPDAPIDTAPSNPTTGAAC